jgi:multiple sugar transport system ATP-binding protein
MILLAGKALSGSDSSGGSVSVAGGSLPAAIGLSIRGEVAAAENLGIRSLVSVHCEGTLIGVTVPEEDEPAPGTPLVLSAPIQRVLLYDKESGELLTRQPVTVA